MKPVITHTRREDTHKVVEILKALEPEVTRLPEEGMEIVAKHFMSEGIPFSVTYEHE